MAGRFYVETTDEYGPLEADAFAEAAAAHALARQLVGDGWRYAVVVDRDEMVPLGLYGDVPKDWN
jgi:hypothetical protein